MPKNIEPTHLQRTVVQQLFKECRDIDISPRQGADIIIAYIQQNYELKTGHPEIRGIQLQLIRQVANFPHDTWEIRQLTERLNQLKTKG